MTLTKDRKTWWLLYFIAVTDLPESWPGHWPVLTHTVSWFWKARTHSASLGITLRRCQYLCSIASNEWWLSKDFEGSGRGIFEIRFCNLPRGTDKYYEKPQDSQCPCQDPNRRLPEYKSRSLLLGHPAQSATFNCLLHLSLPLPPLYSTDCSKHLYILL
jgi:hypothetical protein